MDAGQTLVQSSATTRSWLKSLRERLPQFEYSEARYYAAFRTGPSRRAFAYLNPARRSIRLFLPLEPGDDAHLRRTPSTSSWAARFPSVFPIGGEQDLSTASRLIVKSHTAIRPSTRKTVINRPEYVPAEELPSQIDYVEGAARTVLVNAYERNRRAREKCLRHYGRSCFICGFDFEARYGEVAAGYIQVHHIVPIAKVGREYRLNPMTDLRPVCPNCHAVIHRREPPFSIEEVEQMLENDGAGRSGAQRAGYPGARTPNQRLQATAAVAGLTRRRGA